MLEGNRRIRTITRRSSILQSGGDRRALGRQNQAVGASPEQLSSKRGLSWAAKKLGL